MKTLGGWLGFICCQIAFDCDCRYGTGWLYRAGCYFYGWGLNLDGGTE